MLNILMLRGIGVVKGSIPSHSGFIFIHTDRACLVLILMITFLHSIALVCFYLLILALSLFLNQVRCTNTHLTD